MSREVQQLARNGLTCPKLSSFTFPQNLPFHLSSWQSSLTSLFFHTPHSFHQPIISALPAKFIQNPTTCHHPRCYHPGPSNPHLKPGFSQLASLHPPLGLSCNLFQTWQPEQYFKHKSRPITPQLKSLQYLSLTLVNQAQFINPRM